jgi:hypothetical protein
MLLLLTNLKFKSELCAQQPSAQHHPHTPATGLPLLLPHTCAPLLCRLRCTDTNTIGLITLCHNSIWKVTSGAFSCCMRCADNWYKSPAPPNTHRAHSMWPPSSRWLAEFCCAALPCCCSALKNGIPDWRPAYLTRHHHCAGALYLLS